MPMHHHLRLPVAEVLAEYCQARRPDRDAVLFPPAFHQDQKTRHISRIVQGFRLTVLSPGSPPSLFLLCCAERALQTCKYRQCDGGRHLQRRTANRYGGWLWWEKTLNCCRKKHQTVRFAFCL